MEGLGLGGGVGVAAGLELRNSSQAVSGEVVGGRAGVTLDVG